MLLLVVEVVGMEALVAGAKMLVGIRTAVGEEAKIPAGGKDDGSPDADGEPNGPLPERERIRRVRGLRDAKIPSGTVSSGRGGARGGVESVDERGSSSLDASLAPRLWPWNS